MQIDNYFRPVQSNWGLEIEIEEVPESPLKEEVEAPIVMTNPTPGFAGFGNARNNCWLNALLQLTMHSAALRNIFDRMIEKNPDTSLSMVPFEYQRAAATGQSVPSSVSGDVRKTFAALSYGTLSEIDRQEDVCEAFRILMQDAKETDSCCFHAQNWKKFEPLGGKQQGDERKLRENQYSEFESENLSITTTSENHFLLDPRVEGREGLSLQQLLDHALAPAPVKTEETSTYLVTATEIQSFRLVEERRVILNAPKEFFIALKRYEYDKDARALVKDDTFVPISPYITINNQDGEPEYFKLQSMITHEGAINAGHYVIYVKGKDDQIVLCNDKSVSLVDQNWWDNVCLKPNVEAPYLLHYVKMTAEEHGLAKAGIAQFELKLRNKTVYLPPEIVTRLQENQNHKGSIKSLSDLQNYLRDEMRSLEEKKEYYALFCKKHPHIEHFVHLYARCILEESGDLLRLLQESLIDKIIRNYQNMADYTAAELQLRCLQYLKIAAGLPIAEAIQALLEENQFSFDSDQTETEELAKKTNQGSKDLLLELLASSSKEDKKKFPALANLIFHLFPAFRDFPYDMRIQRIAGSDPVSALNENPFLVVEHDFFAANVEERFEDTLESLKERKDQIQDQHTLIMHVRNLLHILRDPLVEKEAKEIHFKALEKKYPGVWDELENIVNLDRSSRQVPVGTMSLHEMLEITRPWIKARGIPLLEQYLIQHEELVDRLHFKQKLKILDALDTYFEDKAKCFNILHKTGRMELKTLLQKSSRYMIQYQQKIITETYESLKKFSQEYRFTFLKDLLADLPRDNIHFNESLSEYITTELGIDVEADSNPFLLFDHNLLENPRSPKRTKYEN